MKRIKKQEIKIIILAFFLIAIPIGIYIVGNKIENKIKNRKTENKTINYNPHNFFISFENTVYLTETYNIMSSKYLSGRQSAFIDKADGISPVITIPLSTDIDTSFNKVNCNFWLNPDSSFINSLFIFTIVDTNNNLIDWQEEKIQAENLNPKNWYNFNENFDIQNKYFNSQYSIRTFIHNKIKPSSNMYLDDLEIAFEKENETHKTKALLIDFENGKFQKLSSKYFLSGNFSTYANGINDYSEQITLDFKNIKHENLNKILLNLNYLSETENIDAVFIVSICDKNDVEIFSNEIELVKNKNFKAKNWENISAEIIMPQKALKKGSYFKFYLWNKNSNTVFLDDIYLILKEFSVEYGDKPTAHNFISNPNFQNTKNQAPYKFYYVNREKQVAEVETELNNLFTKSDEILIGKFTNKANQDQIFSIKDNNIVLYDLKKLIKLKHQFQNLNNLHFFSDDKNIFVYQIQTKEINLCEINLLNNNLEIKTKFTYSSSNNISAIFSINENSISIFDNSGNVYDYKKENEKYVLLKTSKLISCSSNNLKIFKSNFFNETTEEVLFIFQDNEKVKYEFFSYCSENNEWQDSKNHANLSPQYLDELDLDSEYFLVDYNNDGIFELLKYDRKTKFNLKLLNFDFRSYKILYNIDFKGFENNQNPKYYEKTKILTGKFINDKNCGIIIFQDNINEVNWLKPKTEIYLF